jgi:hypothetical protein
VSHRYKAAVGLGARARVADPNLSDELPTEMRSLDMAPGTEVTVAGHDEERDLVLVNWTDSQGNPRTTSIELEVFAEDFEEC